MNSPLPPTKSPLPSPGAPLAHFVSAAPFDPLSVEAMTEEQSRVYQASQLRLMWWKFKRHRLAMASAIFLAALYAMILVCEVLAPYNLHTRNMDFIYTPPQRVRLFHDGSFVGPFVYGRTMTLDMDTLKRVYADNRDEVQKIRFFCRGDRYDSGACSIATFIWSARPRTARCSCSAPIGLAATCSRASSTAPASR